MSHAHTHESSLNLDQNKTHASLQPNEKCFGSVQVDVQRFLHGNFWQCYVLFTQMCMSHEKMQSHCKTVHMRTRLTLLLNQMTNALAVFNRMYNTSFMPIFVLSPVVHV